MQKNSQGSYEKHARFGGYLLRLPLLAATLALSSAISFTVAIKISCSIILETHFVLQAHAHHYLQAIVLCMYLKYSLLLSFFLILPYNIWDKMTMGRDHETFVTCIPHNYVIFRCPPSEWRGSVYVQQARIRRVFLTPQKYLFSFKKANTVVDCNTCYRKSDGWFFNSSMKMCQSVWVSFRAQENSYEDTPSKKVTMFEIRCVAESACTKIFLHFLQHQTKTNKCYKCSHLGICASL